jgi:hypothetical protein
VARIRQKINACGVLEGKPKEKCHLKNVRVDGTIILKWIFETGWEFID